MITTAISPEFLRGAVELEQTADGVLPHRLPGWARDRGLDAQLAMVETEPSGVRLAFRTAATTISLRARRTQRLYAGLPARPDGRYDLVIDGAPTASATVGSGRTLTMDMTTGATTVTEGPAATVRFAGLGGNAKDVELWLPHNETTELIELRTDAPITASTVSRPAWVHHGSSISQGSNASGPTAIWPAIAARVGEHELTNLGFGGGALLDPFVARTIRDLPADLISLELGINVVNTDLMRRRAFAPAVHGFLDTIRDGHATTPIVVISPILCPIHEETPGPGSFDLAALAKGHLSYTATGDPADAAKGKLTLQTVRADLARIVADRTPTDPNLTLLDGLSLYGPTDAEALPLPDALHPDTETHRLIGVRAAARLFEAAD
ncbi:MAG: SGNH/GDSL hydrolase family protein [Solirubrobacteraceae bacterium]|nr:SGNH/GDSL hydrolase family protein [Solirubrobacteraceae bacterium]